MLDQTTLAAIDVVLLDTGEARALMIDMAERILEQNATISSLRAAIAGEMEQGQVDDKQPKDVGTDAPGD